MDATILCNGSFPRKDYPRYLLRKADRIVCCDGALVPFLRHAEAVFGEARLPWPEVTDIHILGATGKREDHTIGNLSLLMEYARTEAFQGIHIEIVSDYGTAFAVTDSCSLELGAGRKVSLFSPDNSLQIRSAGLVWPTDAVVFDNWWKATLNRASEDTVRLTFSHPSIALLILD